MAKYDEAMETDRDDAEKVCYSGWYIIEADTIGEYEEWENTEADEWGC